ncbi:rhomboid family intramembrane serine protease [Niallia taxi]|uniref:Rhomboid family intramembrane serine protease n=1 Tax=Niallia taxi TaxID=2499688 RepID=A0A3S2TRZ0_9BACI|nr:rhomboid family intramembrane serine protease [Niallia taxi]MCM3217619.1 rhomboid family intramembrane serine protease [Niallia taxi]MDK8642838.1 rhomboid family intramembrane serine protease [Niallia taxi]MED4039598.1 rhomboid family intramembrane serine protease [Niallia taxi]MED4054425.1 rhomboid family intramembrane serine protease [Niallia taxi]MED4120300.1 rhomboid family intramembrane serine protease [Niallia taxi]
MFTRRESFKEYITFYPIVSLILLVNLLVYLATFLPVLPNQLITESMVGVNLYIVQGEWWRLITPIFLHTGFSHFLFNCFSIFLFGPALERALGKPKFLAVYLFTGILANIATLVTEPLTFSHLGASGSIFGMFGYYIALIVFRKDIISRNNSQVIGTIAALSLIMTFIQPNINIGAHLFGFLFGVAAGSLLEAKGKKIIPSYKEEFLQLRGRIRSNRKPPAKTLTIWAIIIALALIGLFR